MYLSLKTRYLTGSFAFNLAIFFIKVPVTTGFGDIQKRYLQRRFSRPKLGKLKGIAIDEISIGKGHQYLTVVLDLKTGAVVFVGDGKGADALTPFWKRIRLAKAEINAVSIDMSQAYISAIIKNLPDAKIVFDHFHVIKLFNDKLSKLRRELYHEVNDVLQKKVIKSSIPTFAYNAEAQKECGPRTNNRERSSNADQKQFFNTATTRS